MSSYYNFFSPFKLSFYRYNLHIIKFPVFYWYIVIICNSEIHYVIFVHAYNIITSHFLVLTPSISFLPRTACCTDCPSIIVILISA